MSITLGTRTLRAFEDSSQHFKLRQKSKSLTEMPHQSADALDTLTIERIVIGERQLRNNALKSRCKRAVSLISELRAGARRSLQSRSN